MLDDHQIVIRERGYFDLLDLSLRVVDTHAAPLAAALLAGAGPFVILNAWILGLFGDSGFDNEQVAGYCFRMLFLIAWEIPLATAPMTLYLGQALFNKRPEPRQIVRTLAGSFAQLFVYQVLLRGLLLLIGFTAFIPFVLRPYLNEVILLERNPMNAGRTNRMTTRRRASAFHRTLAGEFFARWLSNLLIAAILLLSIWLSAQFISGILVGEWEWQSADYTIFLPFAAWIVVGFFAVVRFLGYLDLRIRREGWEIELLMRAEQGRWTNQWA